MQTAIAFLEEPLSKLCIHRDRGTSQYGTKHIAFVSAKTFAVVAIKLAIVHETSS
jgi:hypothetical protein